MQRARSTLGIMLQVRYSMVCPPVRSISLFSHRRMKVLNTGDGGERGGGGGLSGKVQIIGWGCRGEGIFAGCKLIEIPAPQSVPNNYISHIEN